MGPHDSTRHHTVPHSQVGPTPSSFLPAPPPARTAARSVGGVIAPVVRVLDAGAGSAAAKEWAARVLCKLGSSTAPSPSRPRWRWERAAAAAEEGAGGGATERAAVRAGGGAGRKEEGVGPTWQCGTV